MAMELIERPLITFALFAYNQERYIREAVEGALAQTYQPLEIILSDDHSADRTYEIIQEIAAAYRGPHAVVLNRNARNLGIGGHVNRIMELAHGELIVAAAGDDVSLAQRVSRIHSFWECNGRKALSLYSRASRITEDGEALGDMRLHRTMPLSLCDQIGFCTPGVHGATHAWHRRLFEDFGPLPHSLNYEDRAIPFRALLLGSLPVAVDETLVRYREHSHNLAWNVMNRAAHDPVAYSIVQQRILCETAVVLSSYVCDVTKALSQRKVSPQQCSAAICSAAISLLLNGLAQSVHSKGSSKKGLLRLLVALLQSAVWFVIWGIRMRRSFRGPSSTVTTSVVR
jgi:glycosyltransferase involved in cell wall biosynthesis